MRSAVKANFDLHTTATPLPPFHTKKNMKKIWFWLLPMLAWVGCKSAAQVAYTPEQLVPTEKSVFWKITGNGLKKPSYLLGTIHLIPASQFKLPIAADQSLDKVERVTFEIDMKEMTNFRTQLSLMTKAMMAGGKTLQDLLSPEDYAFVHQKLADKGMPGGLLERLKPLFLSTMLGSEEEGPAATDKMTSVEMEVYRMARRRKLESAGLETAAYQMSVFDSIPYTAQAKMLVEGLRAADSGSADTGGEKQLDAMLRLYREQDITAMQAMISSDESGMAGFEDILLNNRNRNWIPIMGRMMREKPTLFAVGAGHLGGPAGMVALLRSAGYRVEVGQ